MLPVNHNERDTVMKVTKLKVKLKGPKLGGVTFCFFISILLYGLYGCSVLKYVPPEKLPYEKLSAGYNRTKLRTSSTLDVLNMFRSPDYRLNPRYVGVQMLSQSDTIVASSGRSKDGYKTWFCLVVFDEHRMTANRKYFFYTDEKAILSPSKPKYYMIPPKQGLIFNGELVLQPDLLTKPFATEEAEQLAILRQISESLQKDVAELCADSGEFSQGNNILVVSAAMLNQVFRSALLELDESPVLATKLSEEKGVEFDHISFGKGRIRMIVRGDIVTVKIKLGFLM
jgi:hypothetical protein